ncbi:hypothetical protein GCM10022206_65670 [Streptomyces chiangmaiensis]
MDTPGYAPVSANGTVADGADLPSFTTGRGSLLGSRPVPCLKISTTSGASGHAPLRTHGHVVSERIPPAGGADVEEPTPAPSRTAPGASRCGWNNRRGQGGGTLEEEKA